MGKSIHFFSPSRQPEMGGGGVLFVCVKPVMRVNCRICVLVVFDFESQGARLDGVLELVFV